jgi:hypothetical protein
MTLTTGNHLLSMHYRIRLQVAVLVHTDNSTVCMLNSVAPDSLYLMDHCDAQLSSEILF